MPPRAARGSSAKVDQAATTIANKAPRVAPDETSPPRDETPSPAPPKPAVSAPSVAASPPAPTPTVPAVAKPPTGPTDVVVHVEVITGGITNVKAPIAIGARYRGLPVAGPAKAFDRLMDFWLTRAIDLGMIGAGLGQVFPINLQRRREAGKVKVDFLLLLGMGEPGRFAPDDLRYLMSNATVAVKSMRQNQLSIELLGTRRKELTIDQAVRGFLEGILDGYERFRVIAEGVKEDRDLIQALVAQPLFIMLVESDSGRAQRIYDTFQIASKEQLIPGLQLEVTRGDPVPPDPMPDVNDNDTDPDVPITLLRVIRTTPAADGGGAPATPELAGMSATEVFQYSALSELAAVTVREFKGNPYLVREFPNRLIGAASHAEREPFGTFFVNYLVPDDFRKFMEGASNLTLEVDDSTAAYPWEMAATKQHAKTSFLGLSVPVSRQFRTELSPGPGSPPPLNRVLKVLIIADPASGNLSLPYARQEGLVVLEMLDHAQRAWKGQYEFQATVCIGSYRDSGDLDSVYDQARGLGDWVRSVGPCDPFKLAMLIVDEQFDVIHYAGHGFCDRKTSRAGWVLDRDCFLSAAEIFRVRQVPRLVFANACFSTATTDPAGQRDQLVGQRDQLVGLAQAFFARGIPNFIGAGWQVDDACARECARWFYTRVLGLQQPANSDAVTGTSPPATIGDALLQARRAVFQFNKDSSTWGAYQHYGRVSDKLLPLPNTQGVAKV